MQRARDLPAAGAWFLTVRVGEVGVLALLAGALLEARYAWYVGAQFATNVSSDGGVSPSLMQRFTGMALLGGYRLPVSLLAIAPVLAGLLAVLHRCQPVTHTRLLRWEWLTLWVVATLLAFAASAVSVVALFADNPFSADEGGDIRPGYQEQVVSNVSWVLGALLFLLPLLLWWARLPDPDEFAVEPAPSFVQVPETDDRDAIPVDDVEQIAPVERQQPRDGVSGDGSSSSGYDGYFRRP